MTKISIIVPMHNAAEYISQTIDSVIKQTLQEIELICVDDNSTDDTVQLLEEYQKKDSRIKIIKFTENKSALQGRKEGVLAAEGTYIMFLDADDYLAENACEVLFAEIEKQKTDIVHFCAEIVDCGAGQPRTERMQPFIMPHMGKITGKNIFTDCFENNKFRFTLWNKIYKAALCKKAFNELPEGYFPKANDLYAFFILAYYAESYAGIQTEPLYFYCFGRGSTGNQELTMKQFEVYCHQARVAEGLRKFAEKTQDSKCVEIAQKITMNLLNDCVWNWKEYLPKEDGPAGFDLLVKYWGNDYAAAGLVQKVDSVKEEVVPKMLGAECLKATKKEIHTIGIFYHRIARGGVQRVISLQIPMFIEMGYKVVLFTDEYEPEDEYDIPEEVTRVILPTSLAIKNVDYFERAVAFNKELQKNNIDVVLYHAASLRFLMYDAIIVKTLGIPIVLTVHELFSHSLMGITTFARQKTFTYRLMNKVLVLSETEKLYWNTFGINARYMPNPIDDFSGAKVNDGNYVVWVGRLEMRYKQCTDVIDIFNDVVQEVPDAKLKIVGNEVTAGIQEKMEKKVEDLGIRDNIEFCGFQKDVGSFYEGAMIHLMTSSGEAFPMSIIESKSYGLPLVVYEMPYLELLKDKKGYISVPQGDKRAAARAVIELMQDQKKRKEMSDAALESIEAFEAFDLKKAWSEVLHGLSEEEELPPVDERYALLLSTMLYHYDRGAKFNAGRISMLNKKVAKFEKKANSKDYKIGRKILYIPKHIYWFIKDLFKR